MKSTWNIKPLSEIVDVRDGTHDSPKPVRKGKLLITTKHLKSSYIDFTSAYYISDVDFDLVNKRSKVYQWDILISMIGTVGNLYLEKNPANYAIKNLGLIKTSQNPKISKYIYYYLLSKQGQGLIRERLKGTTQSFLSLSELRGLPIAVPPLEELQAIAEVLSSIDDKIDLLNRQNETLEAMAQTLFRQWFVEEADDSWEELPITSVAHFLNGLACQKFPPLNDSDRLPVLKIRDLKDGLSDTSDYASRSVDPKYIIDRGDVIFSWSASLVVKFWNGDKCVLNQHLFKVTSELYPKWFYYFWCKHHLTKFIAVANAHATTMGHIRRSDLDNAIVIVPDQAELNRMSSTMDPIIEKLLLNSSQISSLRTTRDTLLPKLMSGEVRVKLD